MKKINLIAFVLLIIGLNACLKNNTHFYFIKGKIFSKNDSLPKVNTKFKLWEIVSNINGGYDYNETYFYTNNLGSYILKIKKDNDFSYSKDNIDCYCGGTNCFFKKSNIEISLDQYNGEIDTLYAKNAYYTP